MVRVWYANLRKSIWKIVKSYHVNLYMVGFSHLKPLCGAGETSLNLSKSGSSISSNYIIVEVVVGFIVVMLLTIGFVLGVKYYKLYR